MFFMYFETSKGQFDRFIRELSNLSHWILNPTNPTITGDFHFYYFGTEFGKLDVVIGKFGTLPNRYSVSVSISDPMWAHAYSIEGKEETIYQHLKEKFSQFDISLKKLANNNVKTI